MSPAAAREPPCDGETGGSDRPRAPPGSFRVLPNRLRPVYGFVILFVSTCGMVFTGPAQTASVGATVTYVIRDLHFSRTLVSGLFLLATMCSAAVLPGIGWLIDHAGSRLVFPLMVACLGLSCAFYAAVASSSSLGLHAAVPAIGRNNDPHGGASGSSPTALSSSSLPRSSPRLLLFVSFLCLRVSGQGGLFLVSTNMLNRWFVKKRARMVGILSVVVAFCLTGVFSSVVKMYVEKHGVRLCYLHLALIELGVLFPLAAALSANSPEEYGLLPDNEGEIPNQRTPSQQPQVQPIGLAAETTDAHEPTGGEDDGAEDSSSPPPSPPGGSRARRGPAWGLGGKSPKYTKVQLEVELAQRIGDAGPGCDDVQQRLPRHHDDVHQLKPSKSDPAFAHGGEFSSADGEDGGARDAVENAKHAFVGGSVALDRTFTLSEAVRTAEFWFFVHGVCVQNVLITAMFFHLDNILAHLPVAPGAEQGQLLLYVYLSAATSACVCSITCGYMAEKVRYERMVTAMCVCLVLLMLCYATFLSGLEHNYTALTHHEDVQQSKAGALSGSESLGVDHHPSLTVTSSSLHRRTWADSETRTVSWDGSVLSDVGSAPAAADWHHEARMAAATDSAAAAAHRPPTSRSAFTVATTSSSLWLKFRLVFCGMLQGAPGGIAGTLQNIVYAARFGRLHNGKIQGLANSFLVASSALGPFLFSYVHDLTGGRYDITMLIFATWPLGLGGMSMFY